MINILIRWVVYAILIIFVSWIVPGIEVDNYKRNVCMYYNCTY